jgi:hypothetical protein
MPSRVQLLAFRFLFVLALLPFAHSLANPSESATEVATSLQRARLGAPTPSDSLAAAAARVLALFRAQETDSVNESSLRAYDWVGSLGLQLLRSPRNRAAGDAKVIEAILDSLGMDTEAAFDPILPQFVLLMVRNPYRLTSHAIGYLYWPRDDGLRRQGVSFRGGYAPIMRVWWTGKPESPYEWGVVEHSRERDAVVSFHLLRLSADGLVWKPFQYPGRGPVLENGAEVKWVDMNRDGIPELAAWSRGSDSLFNECAGCPGLVHEQVLIERENGFEQYERRLLPSPYATFIQFIHSLRDNNRQGAANWVANPSRVAEAVRLGWGSRGARWTLEYAEEKPWPRWLAMQLRGTTGKQTYIVKFTWKDGRWLIASWSRSVPPEPKSAPRNERVK